MAPATEAQSFTSFPMRTTPLQYKVRLATQQTHNSCLHIFMRVRVRVMFDSEKAKPTIAEYFIECQHIRANACALIWYTAGVWRQMYMLFYYKHKLATHSGSDSTHAQKVRIHANCSMDGISEKVQSPVSQGRT